MNPSTRLISAWNRGNQNVIIYSELQATSFPAHLKPVIGNTLPDDGHWGLWAKPGAPKNKIRNLRCSHNLSSTPLSSPSSVWLSWPSQSPFPGKKEKSSNISSELNWRSRWYDLHSVYQINGVKFHRFSMNFSSYTNTWYNFFVRQNLSYNNSAATTKGIGSSY